MNEPKFQKILSSLTLMTQRQLDRLKLAIRGLEARRWRDDDSPENECGWGVHTHQLAAAISGKEAAPPDWRRDPADETGLWWWWNEDEDSLPIPIEVTYSGTSGTYFAMAGQYGWRKFRKVAEMAGWWMRLHEPPLPALAAISQPVVPDGLTEVSILNNPISQPPATEGKS